MKHAPKCNQNGIVLPSRRGFTLLEILITSFILTTGLVSAAWTFAYAAATNRTNQQRTVATLLLQEKLEQMKNKRGDGPAWIPGEYSEYSGAYLRRWTITGDELKTLTVIVDSQRLELARGTTVVGRR